MPDPSAKTSAKIAPLLYVLLGCSLTLNAVFLFSGSSTEAPSAPEQSVETERDASGAPAVAQQPEAAADALASAPVPAAGAVDPEGGWVTLAGKVEHSLARTFQQLAAKDGDALSSVFARLFVWDVDMRSDLQSGDAVAVVWRIGSDGFPEVAAGSLRAGKLGRTLAAYRWQAPGDTYPSYWYLDGTEVPHRLKESPLAQYEQITSLLKDRPTHRGMDFKVPVGTEVMSPRAGVVTRANWNWAANGNGIEIRFDDGVLAKFLHLNENRVAVGDRVSAGQVIALSGNTGRSTAPHLHYQLDRGEKALDPIDYHGSLRRQLDEAQIAALQRDVADIERTLGDAAYSATN
jgi:murein DD-endopeptidase MepM/ murein hydrolase activator NlpD